jgi:hypothetical protein
MLSPSNLKTFSFSILRTLLAFWTKIVTILEGVVHDFSLSKDNGYWWVSCEFELA